MRTVADMAQDLTSVRLNELRQQVSFRDEWVGRLRPGARFFQTLPRDKVDGTSRVLGRQMMKNESKAAVFRGKPRENRRFEAFPERFDAFLGWEEYPIIPLTMDNTPINGWDTCLDPFGLGSRLSGWPATPIS